MRPYPVTKPPRDGRALALVIIGFIVVCTILFVAFSAAYKSTERTVETTVTGKERICNSSGSGTEGSIDCFYVVYTDDGTFQITDSFVYGRFRSSDIYGQIREDRRYSFDVAGWRIPLLSDYPNIISDPKELPS